MPTQGLSSLIVGSLRVAEHGGLSLGLPGGDFGQNGALALVRGAAPLGDFGNGTKTAFAVKQNSS